MPGLRLRGRVLLDVDNVALGHAAGMRWNPADKWLFSEQLAHPPIIGKMQFEHAWVILADRSSRTVQGSLRLTTRLTVPQGPPVQLVPARS